MQDLMKRGENIEELMAKSKDLSTASVRYYAEVKKQNTASTSCC